MKNRKCPNHKACWDYGDCEGCPVGDEITRLHKRIDRLKKQNETLAIQRNAWALTAKAVKEDTIRKMQERLHEKAYIETLGETGNYKMICKCVVLGDIDQITKEMLENNDETYNIKPKKGEKENGKKKKTT